jgi:hypothetical protein
MQASAMVEQAEAAGVGVAPPPLPAVRPGRNRRRAVAAPTPTAEHDLAARAAEVAAALTSSVRPARWALPGFARDVETVRRQLGPLRDRRMLVASYERESSRLTALRLLAADPAAPRPPLDAIEAAYAVRWLELAEGAGPWPAWRALVAGEDQQG